jgi:hypothetical protein
MPEYCILSLSTAVDYPTPLWCLNLPWCIHYRGLAVIVQFLRSVAFVRGCVVGPRRPSIVLHYMDIFGVIRCISRTVSIMSDSTAHWYIRSDQSTPRFLAPHATASLWTIFGTTLLGLRRPFHPHWLFRSRRQVRRGLLMPIPPTSTTLCLCDSTDIEITGIPKGQKPIPGH